MRISLAALALSTYYDGVHSFPSPDTKTALALSTYYDGVHSFSSPDKKKHQQRAKTTKLKAFDGGRRDFLAALGTSCSSASWLIPSSVSANDDDDVPLDLTAKLFNPDGSLKEDLETEAKFRSVEFSWNDANDASSSHDVNVDGVNRGRTQNGSAVRLSYRLPEKWSTDELYFDRSSGINAKACNRITVYRAPEETTMDRLEKASTLGIAKALDVTDDLKQLQMADLIGGRTETRDGQRYFEFDMAVAPASCGSSKEDLGLGFCPYDSIYLLSATILDDHLYVLAIESDKSEWKRANSDLKRLRSSFSVKAA